MHLRFHDILICNGTAKVTLSGPKDALTQGVASEAPPCLTA